MAGAVPKNIVLLSDGTGNTAIKGRGTNVFKLFEALDLNGHRTDPKLTPQIAFYDDGVGTQSLRPLKLLAGATGLGLGRNVRQLYRELCRVYDPGDRIFLFGFSRGAFTVRSLAGLIGSVGILDVHKDGFETATDLGKAVWRAYRTYKTCYKPSEEGKRAIAAFRNQYCRPEEIRIAFLGVWDTVDAVGLPFGLGNLVNKVYRFKFPDYDLGSYVDHACHALAIDDQRSAFHPLLWNEHKEATGRLEQVWFAGAHSNVGGGYPKQGISIVALDWMMQKAAEPRKDAHANVKDGLRFNDTDREFYRSHTHVDDKLYDPRVGLGIFYRWLPRDIGKICFLSGIERPQIHLSVFERALRGTDDYAPGNMPLDSVVVITPNHDPNKKDDPNSEKDAAAWKRAKTIEALFHELHPRNESLLAADPDIYKLGLFSYWVFLTTCIGLVVALIFPGPWSWASVQASFQAWPPDISLEGLQESATLVVNPFAMLATLYDAYVNHWAFMTVVLIGFIVSFAMSYVVDYRLGSAFSKFWHGARQRIRQAVKKAQLEMRGDDYSFTGAMAEERPPQAPADARSTRSPNGQSLQ